MDIAWNELIAEIIIGAIGAAAVVMFAFWRWSISDNMRGRDIQDIKTTLENNTGKLDNIVKDVAHKDSEIVAIKSLAETTAERLDKHEEGCEERERNTIRRFEHGAKAITTLQSDVEHIKSNVAEVKMDIKEIIKNGCTMRGSK